MGHGNAFKLISVVLPDSWIEEWHVSRTKFFPKSQTKVAGKTKKKKILRNLLSKQSSEQEIIWRPNPTPNKSSPSPFITSKQKRLR